MQVFACAGSDSVLKFLSWFVIFVLFWHAFFSGTGEGGSFHSVAQTGLKLCRPGWAQTHGNPASPFHGRRQV